MRTTTLAVATLLTLAACSATPDPGPRFDDQAQAELTCLNHQSAAPGPRYTDPAQRRTEETLAVLRYYTANTAKPYCDNQPATTTDRDWAKLYVDLGADPALVATLLK
ncbi:hypothetical protein [Actinokineospora sp. NBRC 105648]|uniref:hypothetical protein n=1 Tax=Actinokineospora sp. NBRC 105648 TaxID=3032206 RepID=UPI0024A0335F|nr:hypothetical protein [Actinokineospora sp. NBRC 105648]GLZ41939.1 hypothetical protein Acsp05_55630 [Actinokineospora sp. NBRC 105648]